MDRRGEEVVREQEADDGRGDAGDDAADRADRDDEREEQQQHRFQADVVARWDEEHRQEREPDHREHPRGDLAAAGERRCPPDLRSPRRKGLLGLGRLVRDDVHVDRAREPNDPVDDRPAQQLAQARSPARAEHELRAVLGPGEVDERGRDVGRDDLVVLAAEVGEQLLVAHEVLRPRPGDPFVAC